MIYRCIRCKKILDNDKHSWCECCHKIEKDIAHNPNRGEDSKPRAPQGDRVLRHLEGG